MTNEMYILKIETTVGTDEHEYLDECCRKHEKIPVGITAGPFAFDNEGIVALGAKRREGPTTVYTWEIHYYRWVR